MTRKTPNTKIYHPVAHIVSKQSLGEATIVQPNIHYFFLRNPCPLERKQCIPSAFAGGTAKSVEQQADTVCLPILYRQIQIYER